MVDNGRKSIGKIIGVTAVTVAGSVLAGMAIRMIKFGALEYETATEYLADGITKDKMICRKRGRFLQRMKRYFRNEELWDEAL